MHPSLRIIRALVLAMSLALAADRSALGHDDVEVPIERLTRLIPSHPDSAALYVERGELRRIQGDFAGARADFAEMARRSTSHPELDLCRAALALDAADPVEARRLLDAELARRPDEPRALRLRARALVALSARREAIADLTALVVAVARPHPDLYLERARLQMLVGDREGALRGLDQARERLGAVASLELYAIELELALGHAARARERLDALRSQYPDPAPLAGVSARIVTAGGGQEHARGKRIAGTDSPRLAVEAHQDAAGSSDLVWDADLAQGDAPQLTRGPYLQLGTDDAISVRWRTDSLADSRVRYGTSATSLTDSTSDPSLTTEHELRVTGLLPDTRYYYSVGTTTATIAGDSAYTFVTAPVPGTEQATRAWVIGDSGAPTSYAFAVRDAYAAWTGTRGTDLWLMLGDNAYGSGTDSEYQVGVFDQYPLMLRQTVLWPTRGNHDVIHTGANNDYYDIFTMPAAAEAGGLSSGTEAYYAFDRANIHFVCLDSEGSDRAPGGAMLTWLANDLAANTRPWVIAFWHHPPYSKGSHNSDTETQLLEMRENALPILEAAGVDLVLCGHSHSYERSFLLNGHYGTSPTLLPAMVLDAGDGRPDGDGPYAKSVTAPSPNAGAVYAVAGSACQIGGGSLDHPVMVASFNLWGSMVLDVNGDRLDARFLSHLGAVLDSFSIVKAGVVGGDGGPGVRGGLRLGPGLPNPFTLDLRMSYTLERAGHVRLSLHDASGRRVAIAEQGWRAAGTHEACWDGRDGQGRMMPTGVYLAVLEADGVRLSRKIAHVR